MYSLPKNYLTPVLYVDTNAVALAPGGVLTVPDIWDMQTSDPAALEEWSLFYLKAGSQVPKCWNKIMLATKENQVLVTITRYGTGILLQVWEFRNNFITKRTEPDTPSLVYEEYRQYNTQPQPQVPGSFRSLYTLTGMSLQELSIYNQMNKQAAEAKKQVEEHNLISATLAIINKLKKKFSKPEEHT